ncbi:RagB/SusD family nutrient uptake outer membrane protein [Flammeovirga sp. EKP202]|uniref:RagB/SusD family nutrient uptake outer membrane protein n=1 Tax=Flammeovirga sp. EKP202 TaxID=2770592 RepID=UPI00165EDE1F|nr:RagB/SusD family nutrient uptake outer membrane protein [Flammeovirga sp. EKP202]MBD0401624.1 RagB/SusD family nutrient uptake outer membrane protein [Flammeovirga sp. EKP202]
MKNILYIIVMVFSIGCSDFLNREPQTSIAKNEAFENIQNIELAVIGCYNSLLENQSLGKEAFILYPELKGGNLKYGHNIGVSTQNRWRNSYEFNHDKVDEDEITYSTYRNAYSMMNRINNSIHGIREYSPKSESEKLLVEQYLAEVLTLRAYLNFYLANFYCQPYEYSSNAQHIGLVLLEVTPDPLDQPKRSKLYQTYDFIINDLDEALTLYNQDRVGVRKESWLRVVAAKALLSRVNLYKGDWNEVIKWSTEVINTSGLSLVANEDYHDAFSSHNTINTEDIWTLDFTGVAQEALSRIIGVNREQQSEFSVTTDLYDLYDDQDVRKSLYWVNTNTKDTLTYKYNNDETTLTENVYRLVRLSEIYLNRAEASARIGDNVVARSDLNSIVKRANPNAEDIKTSGEALVEDILIERRKELALEGHYYFDLIRNAKDINRADYNGVLNQNLSFPNHKMILPIPNYALDYNSNMEQNEGY